MNLRFVTIVLAACGSIAVGCADDKSTPRVAQNGDPGDKNTDDDERGSVGDPPTPADYCQDLGYTLVGSACTFPDGTSCEEWSFFYGSCGQEHSYCNRHGGQVSNATADAGTYTASYAVCSIDGKTCQETTFFQTGKCEDGK